MSIDEILDTTTSKTTICPTYLGSVIAKTEKKPHYSVTCYEASKPKPVSVSLEKCIAELSKIYRTHNVKQMCEAILDAAEVPYVD